MIVLGRSLFANPWPQTPQQQLQIDTRQGSQVQRKR
jgi:hypothetical protein